MVSTRIVLGGLPVDGVTLTQAVTAIGALIERRRGGFVVTPNIDHIVMARRDARLRAAYERARLSLPDGQPLIWMARALGTPLPAKVSGSDLLDPLMAAAAAAGHRVFLFGGTPHASAEAERRLTRRHAALRIVGRDTSYWTPDLGACTDAGLAYAIGRTRPDLVVVALGSPKQEILMARLERDLAPAVMIGLGGSLDFAAGAVRRAPAWVSQAGLEWFYRLVQEPRRLAYRYLVRDLAIIPIFAADLARRAGRSRASQVSTVPKGV